MKKLFIIFAVLCLAAPAMAADWNFYGSARFATFYVDVDTDTGGEDSDDQDLQWAQQGNSRIGANVKFNDQIGGGFEMSDSFGKRKLFGTYTFGGGSQLLIGQTYTPSAFFYSDSVYDGDGDLLGIGEFYEGRLPMIQWKMGGLKVALIKPAVDGVGDFATDVMLPKIEVGYHFKADMFFADVVGGYQTYDVDVPAGGTDYSVDSYILGAGVGANLGAFYVKVGAHMGTNLGNYGAYQPYLDDNAGAPVAGSSDTQDNDGLGYLAVIGFTVSETLNIEAGYGHEEAELDNSNNKQEAEQYYLNCTINIAPGFFVVPEVGMQTFKEDATPEEPELFYVGAKWQINF
jgi:hypothetical protein